MTPATPAVPPPPPPAWLDYFDYDYLPPRPFEDEPDEENYE